MSKESFLTIGKQYILTKDGHYASVAPSSLHKSIYQPRKVYTAQSALLTGKWAAGLNRSRFSEPLSTLLVCLASLAVSFITKKLEVYLAHDIPSNFVTINQRIAVLHNYVSHSAFTGCYSSCKANDPHAKLICSKLAFACAIAYFITPIPSSQTMPGLSDAGPQRCCRDIVTRAGRAFEFRGAKTCSERFATIQHTGGIPDWKSSSHQHAVAAALLVAFEESVLRCEASETVLSALDLTAW